MAGLLAGGSMWAGCSGDSSNSDGGTDGSTNDVTSQDQNSQDVANNDSGNDAGNDSGGNDSGMGIDASVLDCTYYCSNDIAVCSGTNNQYKDMATCVSMCNSIPDDAGVGATSGDSLACRMYHLSVAATSSAMAAIHCPHTGPYGYGTCGGLCEDFCYQYFNSVCKTDTTGGYVSADACRTYCATAAGSDAGAGAPGNSASTPAMLCREYHLENAIQTGGTGGGHCDHAGLTGGGVCP
jgi:hypothetical protein